MLIKVAKKRRATKKSKQVKHPSCSKQPTYTFSTDAKPTGTHATTNDSRCHYNNNRNSGGNSNLKNTTTTITTTVKN